MKYLDGSSFSSFFNSCFSSFFKKRLMHFSQGFTLPELLVTLAVIAILITMSGPSLKGMIINQQVTAAAREVYNTLILARSEAVKRQQSVSLCSSINGTVCDEDNSGWHHGWLIFNDKDADGILDTEDILIRVAQERSSSEMRITWNRGFSLTFNSRGQTGTAGTFQVCDGQEVKAVVVSMTGRARVEDRVGCS